MAGVHTTEQKEAFSPSEQEPSEAATENFSG